MSETTFPYYPSNDADYKASRSKDTSPSGDQEVRWEVVAKTSGLTPASILAGRLRTDGIPTHVWQEGAGQAIGLTVGILGTGYVSVPEEFAEQAKKILAHGEKEWEEWDETLIDDEEE